MAASSAVTTGDIATAAQYNNLRTDVLDSSSSHTHAGTSNTGVKVNSNNLQGTVLASTVVTSSLTTVGTIATGVWQGTDVGVAYGGTGVSTLTDGGVLLGSGASAITAMAVLADSEMIVGDGTTDPVAESGATLRTSIGVGTGDSPQFTDLTLTDDLTLNSDSSVFKMGDDDGFSITHDGDLGATIAGSPITITAAEASTWSTSSGVLTIDGDDGIILQTTGSGGVTISEATRINVDAGSIATPDASTGLTLVNSSATGDGVQLSLISGNAGYGQIWFGDVNDENRGRFNYKQDTDTFGWSTATAASMYLSGGISPTLQLGVDSTADSMILFETNTASYHIGWDQSADDLVIGKGSTLGTTSYFRMEASGGIAIGDGATAAQSTIGLTIDHDATGSYPRLLLVGAGAAQVVGSGNGANIELFQVYPDSVTINADVTETHVFTAGFYEPRIDVSASNAAVTTAATVYIEAAPTEATSNYALWVDAGNARFDGNVGIGVAPSTGVLEIQRGSNAFSTAAAATNVDNIFLKSNVTQGDGVYGPSISWARVSDSQRRKLAIVAKQDGSDDDDVGMAIFTNPGPGASAMVERLEIGGDGQFDFKSNSLYDVGNAGNEWTAYAFLISNENSGGRSDITIRNNSSDASSSARVSVGMHGGNTSSDVDVQFYRTTGANIYWTMGMDNSNTQAFVISNNDGLGTNDALRITNASPPVATYNATHPTGTFDFVCDSCGRHEAEQFECCGKVEWHDDVLDFRAMALRQPEGIDYMEKVGVIERTFDNNGNPEVFTVLGKDFEFAMSAAFQNRQRMDAQYDEMKGIINRLEKELEEVRNG